MRFLYFKVCLEDGAENVLFQEFCVSRKLPQIGFREGVLYNRCELRQLFQKQLFCRARAAGTKREIVPWLKVLSAVQDRFISLLNLPVAWNLNSNYKTQLQSAFCVCVWLFLLFYSNYSRGERGAKYAFCCCCWPDWSQQPQQPAVVAKNKKQTKKKVHMLLNRK